MMKAWQFSEFGGIDKLALKEVTLRRPANGEALIRVSHAGVNHVDRLVINGRLKWISLPKIPGAEYVGTVAATGPASSFSPGDRVAIFPKMFCGKCRYCLAGQEGVCLEAWNPERAPVDLSTNMLPSSMDGGWAEEALIPERNLVRLPAALPFRDAACLPLSAMTACHMVSRVSPAAGEKAVVVGAAGGVGLFAAQLLKLAGCEVIGVVYGPAQEEGVRKMGVDMTVDRSDPHIAETVLGLTGGYGADIVVDSLGQSTFAQSVNSLAPCGRYVTAGTLTGPTSEFNLMRLYSRQLQLIGSTTGSKKDLEEVVSLLSQGKIRSAVSEVFDFADLPRGIEKLSEHGRVGKILIKVEK